MFLEKTIKIDDSKEGIYLCRQRKKKKKTKKFINFTLSFERWKIRRVRKTLEKSLEADKGKAGKVD